MTGLLLIAIAFFTVYAIYIATATAQCADRPEDFVDAGGSLPGWTFVFAAPGVVLASLCVPDFLQTVAVYGLQYSHVGLGIVVASLCGIVVQQRLALAAEICGIRSPVELIGAYFGSHTIRLYILLVLLLFAIPFAGYSAVGIGNLVSVASGGTYSGAEVVWTSLFFLFLGPVIGGWRGTMYVVAAQSVAVLGLLLFSGMFSIVSIDGVKALTAGIAVAKGVSADKIPGVIQYVHGFGRDAASGGFMTTTAILSFSLSLGGVVLSPAFSFLATTVRTRTGVAFGQVWMMAGLAAGILLLGGPVVAGAISHLAGGEIAAETVSLKGLIDAFAGEDAFAAVCLLMLFLVSYQIVVVFFVSAAANILTTDVTVRFVLPDLDRGDCRLAARIALAVLFCATAILATFAPGAAAVLSPLALSLSVQLLPAFLGLGWIPWMSRGAVITGLIFGLVIVFFTEPAGLILMDELMVPLPWGRLPLTIHSAGWGLAFNVAASLIVSIFTRREPGRERRQRLHDAFARDHRIAFGGRAARGAKWSLPLIWAFLAIGPGAILGNDFFARPIFTEGEAKLGVPSLWLWQVLFWLFGVFIAWWLAYQGRMSIFASDVHTRVQLRDRAGLLNGSRPDGWIGLLLARLTTR